jgi:hypothetical protein
VGRIPESAGRFSRAAALLARRAPWNQPASSALQPGAVVGERYRLEAPLGRGGMGVVYAAVHLHTRRAVALKLSDCAWNDDTLALYGRLLAEARAASVVQHRNIVDVLDMGYHAGAPYLVMERLYGESLEQAIDRLRVVPVATALAWLLPVMGALATLHENGIVHRDVKPSNIFLAHDEAQRVVPKLLDFGLARAVWDAPLTEPGVTLGTPEYMAPERVRCERVGPQSDVWSMGVVLFECLCGRLPLTATDLSGVAAQILSGDLLRARAAQPQLPAPIAEAIDRALQLAPEARHPGFAAFAGTLGDAAWQARIAIPEEPDPVGLPEFGALRARGASWTSGPLALHAAPGQLAAAPAPAAPQPTRWRGSLATGLALLLTLLVFIASAAIWRLARSQPEIVRAPAPSPPGAVRAQPVPAPVRATAITPDLRGLQAALQHSVVPLPVLVAPAGAVSQPREPAARRARARKARQPPAPSAGLEQGANIPRAAAPHERAGAGELEKEWL